MHLGCAVSHEESIAAQTAVITPATVYAAALTTGIIWLILGLTGAISLLAKIVARPVLVGMILGLGLSFMLEGVKMISGNWIIGVLDYNGVARLYQPVSNQWSFLASGVAQLSKDHLGVIDVLFSGGDARYIDGTGQHYLTTAVQEVA